MEQLLSVANLRLLLDFESPFGRSKRGAVVCGKLAGSPTHLAVRACRLRVSCREYSAPSGEGITDITL